MHRNASGSAVLPGLVLAVIVAALSLFVAPSATTGPTQLLGSAAATSASAPHDEATMHRVGAGPAHPLPVHQLPFTVLADTHRAASPQSIATGTGSRSAEPGADTTSTVQGRAPPATAR